MSFILTAICAAGVSFYLRFLVALCKECRFTRICYLVRLEPKAREGLMSDAPRGGTIISASRLKVAGSDATVIASMVNGNQIELRST